MIRDRRSALVLLLAGAAATCVACTPTAGGPTTEVTAELPVSVTVSPEARAKAPLEDPLTPWAEAIALGRWREACASFDLEHPELETAEQRFVRARIALELEDYPKALELLGKLNGELPEFSTEVAEQIARAQLHIGPFLEAATVYEKRGNGAALDAARAYARAKQVDRALVVLRRAIDATPTSSQVALTRLLAFEAELLETEGARSPALQNYQRLALEFPTAEASRGADLAVERSSGGKLTRRERYARAEAFTSKGDFEAASRELELMNEAPGPGPRGVEVLRTMAWAHYKSRHDYEKASRLFSQAAELDPVHRTQDLFFSARALSRAHQDALAIERYLALAKQNPKSSYAEQARFFAARLYSLLGRLREAVLAFNDYQKRYPSGRFLNEVRLERGLARLALGDGEKALPDLDQALKTVSDERERLHLRQLRGLALALAGNPDAAAQEWASVIDERPLSLAALLSVARLRERGKEPPPYISGDEGPSIERPSLDITLPLKVEKLFGFGLHADAARELYGGRTEFVERHAPRGEEALCEAFGLLSTAELRFGYAHRVVPERVLMRAISGETRWQWDCIYPRPYQKFVAREQADHGVPNGLVFAVMRQESAFKPEVRSPVGAVGLMQLMPKTAEQVARELDVEYDASLLTSPPDNIRFGAFYLGKLLRTFDGSVPLAAAAYNAGPGAVRRWLSGGQELPLDVWLARIPYAETRGYVRRVVANWARYRYLEGGVGAVPELELSLPEVAKAEGPEY